MNLLYSTWNYTQYIVITYNSIICKNTESLCSVHETNRILQINYSLIENSFQMSQKVNTEMLN